MANAGAGPQAIHNLRVSDVGHAGEIEFVFRQFTDAEGRRHMLRGTVRVCVSGKMPLVMVLETLHRFAGEALAAEAVRFAPLPEPITDTRVD